MCDGSYLHRFWAFAAVFGGVESAWVFGFCHLENVFMYPLRTPHDTNKQLKGPQRVPKTLHYWKLDVP